MVGESAQDPGWDKECDLVVVGSGGGGLTGAYAAASAGLETIVLEKTAYFGGTTAYAGAGLWLPDTDVQRRAGVEDSLEDARTYLREVVGDYEAERRDAYLAGAEPVLNLLEANPNLQFQWISFPDYFPVRGRCEGGRTFYPVPLEAADAGGFAPLIRPKVELDRPGTADGTERLDGGRALVGRLLLALTELGNTEFLRETPVESLVVEEGRVVGVEARGPDGATLRIKARRGVLLTAGGMESAAELRTANGVPGSAARTIGPRGGNTGQMIEAAVAIGADTALLDEAWWCTGTAQPEGRAGFLLGIRRGVIVDATGSRFFNEAAPYDQGARALIERGIEVAYLVFDSAEGDSLPALVEPDLPAAENLAAGTWVTADTVAGIAAQIDVPAAALEATVEEFNGYSETGVDEAFHRGEDPFDLYFSVPPEGDEAPPNPALRRLDKPPYYAAQIVVSDLGTKGGLRIDNDGRVLRPDGSTIDGLYAAGNTTASFTAHAYPGPGLPIGSSLVFSHRAVLHMTAA